MNSALLTTQTLLVVLLSCCLLPSQAQTDKKLWRDVHGKVIDGDTGQPILFAPVWMPDMGLGTTTDLDGNFCLRVPRSGVRNLHVAYTGYRSRSLTVSPDANMLMIKLHTGVVITEAAVPVELTDARFRSQQAVIVQSLDKVDLTWGCSTVHPAEPPGSMTIVGTVSDESGLPLIAANVVEGGTQNGTSTDTAGFFELELNEPGAQLEVSYLGYLSQIMWAVESDRVLQVQLAPDMVVLPECTIVGLEIRGTTCCGIGCWSTLCAEPLAHEDSVQVEKVEEQPKIRAFPNPFSDHLTLRFTTPCEGEHLIRLVHTNGIVAWSATRWLEAGTQEIEVIPQLPRQGMYVAQVSCPQMRQSLLVMYKNGATGSGSSILAISPGRY